MATRTIKPLTARSRVQVVAIRNRLADRIDRLDRSREHAAAELAALDEVLRAQPNE